MRFRLIASGGLLLFLAVFSVAAKAQKFSAWSAPVNLGPVVNTAAGDTCPAISKNGLTLYFARGGIEIWFTTRESLTAPWEPPQRLLAPINESGSNNFCPVLVVNGHYLYFVSNRARGCGGNDMYVSFRKDKSDNFGWETPVNLGCQVNSPASDLRPSPFEGEDGTEYLYFSSNRLGGPGGFDIYASTMQSDGTFGPPSLVAGLNTPSDDARPNVRERDGLEIFFDSTRTGGVGGVDLWTSTRESVSDPWSAPTNLGPVVNSTVTDQRPSLSWDGTALYFQSNRSGGSGGMDLWVTTRTKLRGHVEPVLYSTTNGGATLVRIDVGAGTVTTIGDFGVPGAFAVAVNRKGNFYTVTQGFPAGGPNPQLASVNPATAQATPFGVNLNPESFMGIGFSHQGKLYGVNADSGTPDQNSLYQFDLKTGKAKKVGVTGACGDIMDLAWHPDGTLYGAAWDSLYRIEEKSGKAELVTKFQGLTAVMGLAIDDDGNFYVSEIISGSPLWRVDPVTGAVSAVAGVSLSFPHGLESLSTDADDGE